MQRRFLMYPTASEYLWPVRYSILLASFSTSLSALPPIPLCCNIAFSQFMELVHCWDRFCSHWRGAGAWNTLTSKYALSEAFQIDLAEISSPAWSSRVVPFGNSRQSTGRRAGSVCTSLHFKHLVNSATVSLSKLCSFRDSAVNQALSQQLLGTSTLAVLLTRAPGVLLLVFVDKKDFVQSLSQFSLSSPLCSWLPAWE